jgi:hypothetical protein
MYTVWRLGLRDWCLKIALALKTSDGSKLQQRRMQRLLQQQKQEQASLWRAITVMLSVLM